MRFSSVLIASAYATISFEVEGVQRNQTDRLLSQTLRANLANNKAFKAYNVEAASSTHLLSATSDEEYGINGLLKAAHLAYAYHYGLTLSPEVIYVAVLQGVSNHVNKDPEKHRSELGIKHAGKEEILLLLESYPGLREWEAVFEKFHREICSRTSCKLKALLNAHFTTSTRLSTAVNSLTVMDIYKSYFDYSGFTLCGIPQVTLEGTPADWAKLRDNTKKLLEGLSGTEKWSTHLLPVLDHFVYASTGNVSVPFWKSLYKYEGRIGSYAPKVTGWINVFFPYLGTNRFENKCLHWESCSSKGPDPAVFPGGYTETPFKWKSGKAPRDMKLMAGIVGIDNVANSLKPNLGWAVLSQKPV